MKILYIDASGGVTAAKLTEALCALAGNSSLTAQEAVAALAPDEIITSPVCVGAGIHPAMFSVTGNFRIFTSPDRAGGSQTDGLRLLNGIVTGCGEKPEMTETGRAASGGLTAIIGERN